MSGNLGNILKAAKEPKRDVPVENQPENAGQRKQEPKARQTTTVGKYRNEEYERLTVYVRKDTKKAAARKWEDEGNRDVSDLVQHLLSRYLTT
jgi:hypothetical protein